MSSSAFIEMHPTIPPTIPPKQLNEHCPIQTHRDSLSVVEGNVLKPPDNADDEYLIDLLMT